MSAPTRQRLTSVQMNTILTAVRAVDEAAALLPAVLAHVYDALLCHDGRRLAASQGSELPIGWSPSSTAPARS